MIYGSVGISKKRHKHLGCCPSITIDKHPYDALPILLCSFLFQFVLLRHLLCQILSFSFFSEKKQKMASHILHDAILRKRGIICLFLFSDIVLQPYRTTVPSVQRLCTTSTRLLYWLYKILVLQPFRFLFQPIELNFVTKLAKNTTDILLFLWRNGA